MTPKKHLGRHTSSLRDAPRAWRSGTLRACHLPRLPRLPLRACPAHVLYIQLASWTRLVTVHVACHSSYAHASAANAPTLLHLSGVPRLYMLARASLNTLGAACCHIPYCSHAILNHLVNLMRHFIWFDAAASVLLSNSTNALCFMSHIPSLGASAGRPSRGRRMTPCDLHNI